MSPSHKDSFTFRRQDCDGHTIVVTAKPRPNFWKQRAKTEVKPRPSFWNMHVETEGGPTKSLRSNDLWGDASTLIGGGDYASAWDVDNITIRSDYRGHTIEIIAEWMPRDEHWGLNVKGDGDLLSQHRSNDLWGDAREILPRELRAVDRHEDGEADDGYDDDDGDAAFRLPPGFLRT